MGGNLSSRKKSILKAIILDYINTAEPIGSRTLVKRHNIALSPATIRNEMADLEELGFLIQPHASAGRIPSQLGYRFFVDGLLDKETIEDQEIRQIKNFYTDKLDDLNQIIHETASVLSTLTRYTSVIISTPTPTMVLKHLDYIQLNDNEGLILFVTDSGVVQHKKIRLNHCFKPEEIEIILKVLKSVLKGKVLNNNVDEILTEIKKGFNLSPILSEFARTVLNSLLKEESTKLVTGGTSNFLTQPEFNDLNMIKDLLGVFEQQDLLLSLLALHDQDLEQEVSVRIGDELIISEVRQCSLITANFKIHGQLTGKIGIIGPQRMDYGKVIRILDYFSKNLDILTD